MSITEVAAPEAVTQLEGGLMTRVQKLLRHMMDDGLRDLGLTTPQFGTLAYINEQGPISGADIARVACLTPQTVHTILSNLEEHGLVERFPRPHHGTVLLVGLTDMGRDKLEQGLARARTVNEHLIRGFSEEERESFRALLQRCHRNLEDAGAIESPCEP